MKIELWILSVFAIATVVFGYMACFTKDMAHVHAGILSFIFTFIVGIFIGTNQL